MIGKRITNRQIARLRIWWRGDLRYIRISRNVMIVWGARPQK